jgi:carboxyl-terminal processing protease
VNWEQVGQQHEPKILAAVNDDVFWKNLDTMVAELGDAHARVLSPRQYAFDKEKKNNTLGLWLAELDGEIIVTSVTKYSAGEKAGISIGNQLLRIDGMPALDWWREQRSKSRKSSTERARLKTVKRVFDSGDPQAPTDTVLVEVERNDGSTFVASLTRSVLARKDALTSTLRPDGFGYLRLTGFDQQLSHEIAPAFAQIMDAKGLVIDLRGNPGGSLALSVSIMNQLVSGRVLIGKRITRTGKPPTLFFGLLSLDKLELELTGVKEPFLGPVVVLVDGDSASASELFAVSLQAIRRATIIGETTCGCLLGYIGYANVPGGGALAYSEMDFAPIRGRRIEGTGVLPDHIVTPSRQDLKDGNDRALEQALSLLRDKA